MQKLILDRQRSSFIFTNALRTEDGSNWDVSIALPQGGAKSLSQQELRELQKRVEPAIFRMSQSLSGKDLSQIAIQAQFHSHTKQPRILLKEEERASRLDRSQTETVMQILRPLMEALEISCEEPSLQNPQEGPVFSARLERVRLGPISSDPIKQYVEEYARLFPNSFLRDTPLDGNLLKIPRIKTAFQQIKGGVWTRDSGELLLYLRFHYLKCYQFLKCYQSAFSISPNLQTRAASKVCFSILEDATDSEWLRDFLSETVIQQEEESIYVWTEPQLEILGKKIDLREKEGVFLYFLEPWIESDKLRGICEGKSEIVCELDSTGRLSWRSGEDTLASGSDDRGIEKVVQQVYETSVCRESEVTERERLMQEELQFWSPHREKPPVPLLSNETLSMIFQGLDVNSLLRNTGSLAGRAAPQSAFASGWGLVNSTCLLGGSFVGLLISLWGMENSRKYLLEARRVRDRKEGAPLAAADLGYNTSFFVTSSAGMTSGIGGLAHATPVVASAGAVALVSSLFMNIFMACVSLVRWAITDRFFFQINSFFFRNSENSESADSWDLSIDWIRSQLTLNPWEVAKLQRKERAKSDPEILAKALQKKWARFARRTNVKCTERIKAILFDERFASRELSVEEKKRVVSLVMEASYKEYMKSQMAFMISLLGCILSVLALFFPVVWMVGAIFLTIGWLVLADRPQWSQAVLETLWQRHKKEKALNFLVDLEHSDGDLPAGRAARVSGS